MDFMTAVKSVYSNYANFSGRAPRSEYWWFQLFFMVVYVVLTILTNVIGSIIGILMLIFALGSLVPAIAVGARRLHDTDKTGWLLLLSLIPLVNFLLLWWLIQPSDESANKYGPNPLAGSAPVT